MNELNLIRFFKSELARELCYSFSNDRLPPVRVLFR